MEKITSEFIAKFINDNDFEYKSSHQILSIPIINRIYQKMMVGIKFDVIKVSENIIIDGHHRYISSLLANASIEKTLTIKPSAIEIYDWKNVEFVSEEWDTQLKSIN